MMPLAPPPTMTMERCPLIGASPPPRTARSGLLLQRLFQFGGAVAHLGQAALVEHIRDRLPHVEHHVPDLACCLVAIVTGLIAGAAGAWERRQRPVEYAHDVTHHDLLGRPCEAIAALLALAALHEAGIAQLDQNGVEKLLGNVVDAGDVPHESQAAGRLLCKIDERLQAVLALPGEHASLSLSSPARGMK